MAGGFILPRAGSDPRFFISALLVTKLGQNTMNAQQLNQFLTDHFPQVADEFVVKVSATGELTVEMPISNKNLRPGQTVSGPSMFALADVTFYLAILQQIGPEALSVTTCATINFMRKPEAEPLVGVPRIHKLGRRLVVGDVLIYTASDERRERPVASASLTYSMPPKQETAL